MNTILETLKTKSIIGFLTLCVTAISFTSCSNDDDNPDPVNEEEIITTMNVTLSATGGTITLQSQDLDGEGPNAPVISVSGNLSANTTYNGSIQLLNETETPAEDITEEVEEEDEEHQFFFTASGALSGVEYDDEDGNGNPVGINFTLTTGDAGNGTLQA
ncbi:type 1 periplasmic binding fold superfamily protein [Maribacter cobaltidurans]|uniref:Uncharacterized protein n=1 Tax=Maribacter cobaltidurans TaxID=1178778 RepID=A0A223VAA7_9FLAO|nr:type 1 periplasmic binding fold superfamily protein [Maribacter cobaltidurans]ASV32100.1 hypothetical protein CJ263_18795 [Maribacter cobaltidurans]GGD91754.1 hypothetical protein GCM10011412_32180 [Maribacter cobaltidurans]